MPERTLKTFCVTLAFTLLWQCAAVRAADERPWRVLLLHPYNYSLPSTTTMAEAIRGRLSERSPRKLEIDGEHLDLARARDPGHEQWLATFLRERYARTPPDVIVALSESLPFLMRHGDTFAMTTPVVFNTISPETYASLKPPSHMTGTLFDTAAHLDNTLALAERLQPDARRLFVIAGNSALDRRWQATARRVIEGRQRPFETTYLFDLSYDRIVEELLRVPKDSIVVILTVFEDITGKSFIALEVGEALIKLSPAPVYSPYYSPLGKGLVGGSSQTFEDIGAATADIVLQVLAGKAPTAIPVQTSPEPSFRVDYKAMQRWGLSEKNLPAETTVLFKDPTIWDQHRNLVLAALAVIGLQSIFASALLLERRWRVRAEGLLTESEERMTFTAAAANVGLWQYNPETHDLWATEHCRAIFGLGPDAPLTRDSLVAAIHPEDREAAIASLGHISRSGVTANSDVRVVWPDLQIRWIRIVARSHQDDRHRPGQLSGTFIDISDQKAAEVEAALQRREIAHLTRVSALGELSGAIAHEINQPLTAILFNAQAALHMLSQDSPDLDETRNALEDIVHEDNRAGQVIQRLKSLLKKDEGTRERIELNELVNTTIALLNSELIGRGVSVQVVLANDLPVTSGDPVQLQQVLINFIVNAMDAMAATPAAQRLITISTCATRNGGAEVVVRDRGTGVDTLEQKRVFEPFFTTKQHGLGLGLTICSSIIETHGGELSLTNSAGGGAEARFSLPGQEMLIAAQ